VKSVHVFISGRVQGVGYRDWLVREANLRGVRGWVRNTGPTQVEAVICGAPEAVDSCVAACWEGPPGARVDAVQCLQSEPIDRLGFIILPSV
jgi:acylphosphatase